MRNDGRFDGFGIRAAGDIDKDGFGDLLITPASTSRFGSFRSTPPQSYLVFGRAGMTGVNLLPTLSGVLKTNRDAGWVALGDVNGDGFADLGANSILARPLLSEASGTFSFARHSVGEVFFGRASARTSLSLDTPDLVIEPGKPNYDLPEFRANLFNTPGDINRDGKSDFVLADSFGGFSRVYFGQALQPAQSGTGGGGATLPPEGFQFPLADPSAGPPPADPPGLNLATSGPNPDVGDAVEVHGSQVGEHLSSARSAGDLNGDGVDDLIVEGTKHSYIIFGPAKISGRLDVASRANIIFDRSTDPITLAQSMGDINGDGINDLIIVRTSQRVDTLYDLSIGVFFGGPTLPHRPTLANADVKVTFANGFNFDGLTAPFNNRTFTVSALNFNGDKFEDLLITARSAGEKIGYVISGQTLMNEFLLGDHNLNLGAAGEAGPLFTLQRDQTARDQVQLQFFGQRSVGWTGSSQQDLSSMVVGDINGDGLDDIVLADKGFAIDEHGAPPIGRAYVFLGRPDYKLPPVGTPNEYTLDQADRIYQGVYFGENVVAAGDMNADGYADFAVGRSREGGSQAPASLLFYYGKPQFAGPLASADTADQFLSRKTGDVSIGKIEAALQSSVFLEGTMWATTGDFNGDGKLDLAVGEPKRTVRDSQDVILDVQQRGQVYVFFSIADRPNGLSLANADRVIAGEGEFDQFGVLSPTGPIDLNRDHTSDLVIGAPGADVISPTLTAGGGKIYVVYDGVVQPTAPAGVTVVTLTNQTVTGDGDFLVGQGGGQSIVFNNPASTFTLNAGQTERWYTFTTEGDGQADSVIRLTPAAKERATKALHGSDGGLTPVSPGTGFTLQADGATLRVGGATGGVGIFEFDLSPYLAYVDQTNFIEQVQLQLDYANATIVAGQKLSVFVGQVKGNGVVSPTDGSAAATLAGERPFGATDASSGVISIDITAAIRAALAAGKTHIMLRLVASSTQVSLDVQRTANTARQTALLVTTARQHGVVGDLLAPDGTVLARGLSVISLRPFNAGTFLLRVYDPFGAAPSAIGFTIEMVVPTAGATHADADRDQVSGGDGDDTVTGNGGIDRLFGNSGTDSFVGDDVEGIDQQTGELRQTPNATQSSNIAVPDADPVVTIPDAGLRSAIADALGIGHTPAGTGLTRPLLASQLAQIRELDASGRGITDLSGLELLANLETLNLARNNISRLSYIDASNVPHGLVGLSRLRNLDLGFNRLSDSALPAVAALVSLRQLILDGNTLRVAGALAALVNLTLLSADGPVSPIVPTAGPIRGSDLLGTFTNPTPALGDQAGRVVGSVGRFLVVADPFDDTAGTDAGAVYLYDGVTGQPVRTLTNGAPGSRFGSAIAAVGNLLLVSAPFSVFNSTGVVYVYDATTGNLVSAMVPGNPMGGAQWGAAMTTVGQEVLISAPGRDFVMRVNPATGDHIAVYLDPVSDPTQQFGAAIAADANHLYVGAPGRDVGATADVGAAYILNLQTGAWTAIANPENTASSGFGSSIAAVGDNVAIGAPRNKAGVGAVYLFNGQSGAAVRTIDNPGTGGTPDRFGTSLATFNDSLLVVGAPPSGLTKPGAVYVMDATTGAAVQTLTNPVVNIVDQFGASVAVVDGGGDILVGAPAEQAGGIAAGAATLFKGPRIADASPLGTIAGLKSLSLANDRISNAANFGSMTNLERLYLNGDQITGGLTPLTTLAKLKSLTLNRNPLDNPSFTTSIPTLTSKVADLGFDADQAPVIAPIGARSTVVGTPIVINLTGSDPDAGDGIFFTGASSNNPNVTVQLSGNQLVVTPPPAGSTFTGVATITVTAVDGASGAQDWRGRSTTRTFDVSVGLATISGAKYGDVNRNGIRDPEDAGIANWTFFLDTDADGVLDAGERTAVTDADGNYAFSGLAPGTYNVAEVLKSAWTPTAPRTFFNANFTGGAVQGFATSGAADPWHVTSRHSADAGHSAGQSFYFGSEATGTYANSSTGTLTSPLIDLTALAVPVRLDFNQLLTTTRSNLTLSQADFTNGTPTVGSADGYKGDGLWHLSTRRGTSGGHSGNFSMYFGSDATGTYANGSTGAITSPIIDLTGLTGPVTLRLNYFLAAASGILGQTVDGAAITVISGANRTVIARNGTRGNLVNTAAFTQLTLDLSSFAGQQIQLEFAFAADSDGRVAEGWYVDDVTVTAQSIDLASVGVLSNGIFTPLADNSTLGGLADSTGVFNPVSLDLSAFLGQQIQVQFRFASDALNNAEGWYVDDVKVSAGGPTTFTLTGGQTAAGVDFGGVMVANAGPDQIVPVGQLLNLPGIVTDPNPNDGSNFAFSWSVVSDNGQAVPGATTQDFSFTPSKPGTYTVTFTVTDHDDNDHVYTDTAVISAIDAAPPSVTSASFASPNRVVVQFSEDVTIAGGAAALVLENLTTGQTIPAGQVALAYDPATFRATFTYNGAALLPDGIYRATLQAANVHDQGGNALGAGSGGGVGTDYVLNFAQLAGDVSGDGKVDIGDFSTLFANMGRTNATPAQGDLNGDRVVDIRDYQILELSMGNSLPPQPPAAPAPVQVGVSAPVSLAKSVVPAVTKPATKPVAKPQPKPVAKPQSAVKAAQAPKFAVTRAASSNAVKPKAVVAATTAVASAAPAFSTKRVKRSDVIE
ncbi:MAG TPA: SdrD B-like domain-containing protein [Tepidisphaeraceae bacterium]